MLAYLDGLLPLIIDTLQESSASKRSVALKTLRQLLSSTGYVITPALKYPQLLPTLLNVLKSERNSALRVEVLKVIGTLGAVDPITYKWTQANPEYISAASDKTDARVYNKTEDMHSRSATLKAGDFSVTAGAANGIAGNVLPGAVGDLPSGVNMDSAAVLMSQTHEDYYPTIVIQSLMRILCDPRLSQHHHMVIKAIMFIFRSLGVRCAPFLPSVIPAFLSEMRTCESSLRETFFQHLCGIVVIVKQHIRNYLDGILDICMEYWHSTALLPHLLALIEELSIALRDEFKPQLPLLIPKLLAMLHSDKSETKALSTRVLHALRTLGASKGSLDEYLHILVPALIRLCEASDESITVRIDVVDTVGKIATMHDISDHASRVIHAFARILAGTPSPLHDACLNVLCTLIAQLGFGYIVFEPVIGYRSHPSPQQFSSLDVLYLLTIICLVCLL